MVCEASDRSIFSRWLGFFTCGDNTLVEVCVCVINSLCTMAHVLRPCHCKNSWILAVCSHCVSGHVLGRMYLACVSLGFVVV